MPSADQNIAKAIESLATCIVDATPLNGDAHFNAALQIERALRRFAEALLAAAAQPVDGQSSPQ